MQKEPKRSRLPRKKQPAFRKNQVRTGDLLEISELPDLTRFPLQSEQFFSWRPVSLQVIEKSEQLTC